MTQPDAAPPSAQATARSRLLALLLDADAYNPDNQFINIDHLWATPSILEPFCHHLAEFLRETLPLPRVAGLISIDSTLHPFGPVPIATQLAVQLSLRLGIWKENADPVTGDHRLFGHLPAENSLVLYDVTRFGLTAMRALLALHNGGCHPRWLVTLVDCERGAAEFLKAETRQQMGQEIVFVPVLTLTEVAATFAEREKE